MSLYARLPASFRMLLRRFGRSRRASAAVQFAFIAPLFFGLLFSIIETALMFFAGQVLETMAQDSARTVMTGQAQSASYATWSDFRDKVVCKPTPVLFTCSNLRVDVQSYTSFQSISLSSQIDGTKCFVDNMQYSPGGSGSIVVVRLFYQWPTFVTNLGFNLSNLCNGSVLLSATAAFKNEPFSP